MVNSFHRAQFARLRCSMKRHHVLAPLKLSSKATYSSSRELLQTKTERPFMLRLSCAVAAALAFLFSGSLAQNPGSNPAQTITQDPNDWPMYNHDAVGTRGNPTEDKLNLDSVRGLKVKWVFPTVGDIYGTPSRGRNINWLSGIS